MTTTLQGQVVSLQLQGVNIELCALPHVQVYKSHLVETGGGSGPNLDSAHANLANTFVNALSTPDSARCRSRWPHQLSHKIFIGQVHTMAPAFKEPRHPAGAANDI